MLKCNYFCCGMPPVLPPCSCVPVRNRNMVKCDVQKVFNKLVLRYAPTIQEKIEIVFVICNWQVFKTHILKIPVTWTIIYYGLGHGLSGSSSLKSCLCCCSQDALSKSGDSFKTLDWSLQLPDAPSSSSLVSSWAEAGSLTVLMSLCIFLSLLWLEILLMCNQHWLFAVPRLLWLDCLAQCLWPMLARVMGAPRFTLYPTRVVSHVGCAVQWALERGRWPAGLELG